MLTHTILACGWQRLEGEYRDSEGNLIGVREGTANADRMNSSIRYYQRIGVSVTTVAHAGQPA